MSESLSHVYVRAQQVAGNWGIALDEPIGHGIDGNVWRTSRQSALKVFARRDTFERERDCYNRLFESSVERLAVSRS